MTTIGYATLQIIGSLRGVTEQIDSELDGKVVSVTIEPKVDKRAAEKAGKETGDAVTKATKDAVAKGDIGKTVNDEIAKSVKKSSAGKETAKILVDGISDGVQGELRGRGAGGAIGAIIVAGVAEGVKQGIDGEGIGGQVVNTIGDGIKSKDLGGTIKDAVLGSVRDIGSDLRTGAKDWSSGIADALRSGDIQGATDGISFSVLRTTDTISSIGEAFGLQLDGVRTFGEQAAATLSQAGGVVDTALSLKSTFTDTGDLLGNILPGRAGTGAKSIIGSLGTIVPVALGVYEALDKITQEWHEGQQDRFWKRQEEDRRARELGTKPAQPGVGDLGGAPAVGQTGASRSLGPSPQDTIRDMIRAGKYPGASIGPNGEIIGPDGKPFPGFTPGGYTGNLPIDKIAGVVHGGEYVINKQSTDRVQSAFPGLLPMLNGYGGGGLVAGTAELGKIISEKFGISNIGGYRPGGDGFNEHVTGRALDVMTSDKAKGDAIKDFALQNASAIDLKWVIWRQHLYNAGGGGYDMPDRGSPTQNHMDHVHIFSGAGITNGLRGALKGAGPDTAAAVNGSAAAAGPGAIDPSSTDATSAASAPSSSGSSSASKSSFALPSSISGLSSMGLDNLGKGVGTTSSGSDLSLFGQAAGSAVSGQVSSALSVFGINDSPGWLKGISKLVSGISVSDSSGKKIFDGGSAGGALAGVGSGFGSAAPVASSAPVPSAAGTAGVQPGGGGGQAPGPVTNYNIRTATVEDAFLQAQRKEQLKSAAQTSRW